MYCSTPKKVPTTEAIRRKSTGIELKVIINVFLDIYNLVYSPVLSSILSSPENSFCFFSKNKLIIINLKINAF